MMILACFLDMAKSRFRNLLKGKSESIRENLSFLGEPSHILVQSLASLAENSCLVAEALIGIGVLKM